MLLVIREFGVQKPGNLIMSADEIDVILSGEHVNHVVKVALPHVTQAEVEEF